MVEQFVPTPKRARSRSRWTRKPALMQMIQRELFCRRTCWFKWQDKTRSQRKTAPYFERHTKDKSITAQLCHVNIADYRLRERSFVRRVVGENNKTRWIYFTVAAVKKWIKRENEEIKNAIKARTHPNMWCICEWFSEACLWFSTSITHRQTPRLLQPIIWVTLWMMEAYAKG